MTNVPNAEQAAAAPLACRITGQRRKGDLAQAIHGSASGAAHEVMGPGSAGHQTSAFLRSSSIANLAAHMSWAP